MYTIILFTFLIFNDGGASSQVTEIGRFVNEGDCVAQAQKLEQTRNFAEYKDFRNLYKPRAFSYGKCIQIESVKMPTYSGESSEVSNLKREIERLKSNQTSKERW